MDYYKFGFVIVDVNITAWEPEKSHNWTCPTPDPDIAGIGVVLSFLIAGLMTTFSSITAAVLESRINEDGGVIFLPGSIHRWLSLGMTPQKREKCRFWREIFKRLIINLADQQLITGFSLLIIAYIVEPWPLSIRGQYWPARLSLVIYLSCLSSSSHLACMLTLNKYLKDHSGLAKLRIFFIIIFAIVLSISIGLGNTFNVLAYALSLILTHIDSETAFDTSLKIANAILYGFPPLIALHVYWTAVFQLLPREQDRLERLISRFYHKFFSRLVPGRMLQKIFGPRKSAKLRSAIKRFFWWCLFLNPPMIFAMQIIFAIISIVFIFFQKFGGPSHVDPDHYEFNCRGLNNDDENKWGFGQMLAMFVLVLPVLAALETYLGKAPHLFCHAPYPHLLTYHLIYRRKVRTRQAHGRA